MDLVGARQLPGEMARQQPGQARRHRRSDDQRRPPPLEAGADRQQILGVVEVVTDRHHGGAALAPLLRHRGVLCRVTQDGEITAGDRRQRVEARIVETHLVRIEQPRHPPPDDAATDDPDRAHRR